jgi:TonB family protein
MASTFDTPVTSPREPVYRLTQFETPFFLVSLIRQIQQRLREPKLTVPENYYRGEATLPVVEMQPWYADLPGTLKSLFEKPKPIEMTSQPVDVPEIWTDYQPQKASWMNSMLVHALVLTALILPFYIKHLFSRPAPQPKYVAVDISPYLPQLPPSAKKAGGGGGGGDRTPAPASKGMAPKFSRTQFTPPMAKIPIVHPQLPMPPTLLGPPELKVPQVPQANWGDPHGVPGPPSNGPGTGGGIGSGNGTGIGSGEGGGLGPGSGGGTGGGPFSVGGGVSAPVVIYKVEPAYSEEARKAKYQGVVLLWIVVDAQGNVTSERVVKPLGLGLDEKALEAVKVWKFRPAMRNGAPVPVQVAVEVQFRLF